MILYRDGNFFFSSSSVVATFPDGIERPLDNVTIKPSTPLGEEWYLTSSSDSQSSSSSSSSSSQIVRLIVIPPNQDWRTDQNYLWKLDSAWMSDSDDGETAWLHWNPNSYVNSVIQVPSSSSFEKTTIHPIFACEMMEFHFAPILSSGLPRYQVSPAVSGPRVTLQNVRIGAYLNGTNRMNPKEELYYPCPGQRSCSVVDGDVRVVDDNTLSKELTVHPLILMVGILLVVLLAMVCLVTLCCRIQRMKRYEQIIPNVDDNDLSLKVDDEGDDGHGVVPDTVVR